MSYLTYPDNECGRSFAPPCKKNDADLSASALQLQICCPLRGVRRQPRAPNRVIGEPWVAGIR